MMTNLVKKSKREELFEKIKKSIDESGLFSDEGKRTFMSMLSAADALMDVDLVTMFLFRDGMKRHSFGVVNSFIKTLPLKELT